MKSHVQLPIAGGLLVMTRHLHAFSFVQQQQRLQQQQQHPKILHRCYGLGWAQPAHFSASSPSSIILWGILDEINSDSYNLLGSKSSSSAASKQSQLHDAYDALLADLVFSTNDPRIDIANKIDLATDPDFLTWLDNKINSSNDPEERLALRDLFDMIDDVKRKIEVNQLAEDRAQREAVDQEQLRLTTAEAAAVQGRQMSTADIFKKAAAIDAAGARENASDMMKAGISSKAEKKTFYDQELTPEIRLSYDGLLKKVLPPYKPGETPHSVVFINYDQFDAQFVKVLTERSSNGDLDSKALLEALAIEQQNRIGTAANTLKEVLSMGEAPRMEGTIVRLAREGKIDEPFLLLLEANANQAKAAGANGPAELMKRLQKRALEEKDKQSRTKEIRLIRKLLRTEDPVEREKILEDAFTPRDALLVPGTTENAKRAIDGEAPEQSKPMPDVPPPDFINACKAVLLNFGNLQAGDTDDRGDLASQIKKLAAEAEVVATRIYGKGMTLREQQDRVWKEQTTSIFDLERMEIEAERHGEVAPWANSNADDDMFLPGFDKDGRMQIGGQ